MKRIFKKSAVLLLALSVVVFSGNAFVFAAEAETDEQTTYAENIKKIVGNLQLFARYSEVTKESLYQTAFEALLEENPELYEKALKAMLSSVDENSVYYNEEEAAEFLMELNDEVTGIGVNVIMSDGNIIVSQPIPESPAERAGIKAGDIIVGADGYDLRKMDYDEALDKIRGIEGTTVKITIVRSGIAGTISFDIKRERVTQNPVDYEVIENEDKKIAKITVYSFTETVAQSFKEALAAANSAGISNIIIDLRDNGGGYLDQAIEIAGLFLKKGDVITTEDHKLGVLNKQYTAPGTNKKYKVAVLVNGMSASASEVLTAALTENGVAKAVGEKTFGKGTVQTMSMTPDGGIIKYTTAYYLTPNGENIHKVGITPEVLVENSSEPVDMSMFDAFSLSKTYRIGSSGEEVKNAKLMLQTLGMFVGEVNEIYDENLKSAVNLFQKAKGLFAYGVLDITTQMNIYDALKCAELEVDDQLQAAIDIF